MRVKRDILRRSSIGAARHVAIEVADARPAPTRSYGVDGTFAFFSNLTFATYLAKTPVGRRRRRRHQLPGADGLRRRPLRPAARAARRSTRTSIPKSASCAAPTCARTTRWLRFSPRPDVDQARAEVLEHRPVHLHRGRRRPADDAAARRRVRASSSRTATGSRLASTTTTSCFTRPFTIVPGALIPVGRLRLHDRPHRLQLGPAAAGLRQRPRTSRARSTTATARRSPSTGRASTSRRSCRSSPTSSFNWIDLPTGSFTTKLVGSRVTYTLTPLLFASALVQYNSSTHTVERQRPPALGVPPRQRALHRLQRGTRQRSGASACPACRTARSS